MRHPTDSRSPIRILLVDDITDALSAVATILRHLGHHVIDVTEVTQAQRVIESDEPIDLLVTDIVMPGLDGRELVARARSLRPELPVLLLSAYVREGVPTIRNSRFLAKPFSVQQLADEVRSAHALGSTLRRPEPTASLGQPA